MLVKIMKKYASDMRSRTSKGNDGKTDDKIFRKRKEPEHCEQSAKERKGLTR